MTRDPVDLHEEEDLERHRRSVEGWLARNHFDTPEALAVASYDVRELARQAGRSIPPRPNEAQRQREQELSAERWRRRRARMREERQEREQEANAIRDLHRRQSLMASHRVGHHRRTAREACPLCQEEAAS